MQTLDLSHVISSDMPVFPGTPYPKIKSASTLAVAGFVEKEVTLYTHTGTHLDAPAHILPAGQTLDAYPAQWFWGQGVTLDFSRLKRGAIEKKDILPFASTIREADFVLLHTGWSNYWGDPSYFADYPVLTAEAAEWLATFNLKGFGVDAISVDGMDAADYTIHKLFLSKKTVIIENLTNLSSLIGRNFNLFCFPLMLKDADGSPVRAVAIYDE